jgi:N-acetylmuramoyl-L-alanine amidase
MSIIYTHLDAGDKLGIQLPETIIIHAMGEYIGNSHAVAFLANCKPDPLSAHSLVDANGNNYRCRLDTEGAYHAAGYNIDSLGIEFLVPGVFRDYGSFIDAMKTDYVAEAAYQEGLRQIKEWIQLWPIKKIKRHSDVSPERKADPGDGFPWVRLLHDIGMD